MFERGVKFYTKGIAVVEIHFPESEVKCTWCRFCRKDDMGRHWCRLTNEMIYNPAAGLGEECPIVFKENDDEQ